MIRLNDEPPIALVTRNDEDKVVQLTTPSRCNLKLFESSGPPTSQVPDLIYEDQQLARLYEIATLLDRPENLDHTVPLHRLTVLTTYRCNLACAYCKTRKLNRSIDCSHEDAGYDLARFSRLLNKYKGYTIDHLHLTGGEATLLPELPGMIAEAKRRGVRAISCTSNGTATIDRYRALIEAGLDELRLSYDSADPVVAARLSGREQSWSQATTAIEALCELKENGSSFHLIVNIVVTTATLADLPGTLAFVLSLGPRPPDDVKLIPEVDQRHGISTDSKMGSVRQRILELLSFYPTHRFPLLRRKLESLADPEAAGLADMKDDGSAWSCYLALTERTVDSRHYYPCSVYLREGGRPLGTIDEDDALQRDKIISFVRHGDCRSDPLCRRYCLACTGRFNRLANSAIADRSIIGSSKRSKPINVIEQPSPLRLETILRSVDPPSPDKTVAANVSISETKTEPFLLITPLGMAVLADVLKQMTAAGILIESHALLPEWHRLASRIYRRLTTPQTLLRARQFETVWLRKFPSNTALLCRLATMHDFAILTDIKRRLRAVLPTITIRIYDGTGARPYNLHPFHLPDAERLAIENRIVEEIVVTQTDLLRNREIPAGN